MKGSIIDCKINKINNTGFIKFDCGFELEIDKDRITYKTNNQVSIFPSNEDSEIKIMEEIKKTYDEKCADNTNFALMYFFIKFHT